MRTLFEADYIGMSAQIDDEIGGQIDKCNRGYVVQENGQRTEIGNLLVRVRVCVFVCLLVNDDNDDPM